MRAGPLYMTLAGLAFTLMVVGVKEARSELVALDVMVWRGLIATPLAWAWARRSGETLVLVGRRAFAYRAGFGFFAMSCFYTAAKGLPIADLSIVTKLQPIIIAFAAPLVLGARERAGAWVWLILAAGLAGSAVLLAPALEVGNWFGLWALAGTVLSSGAHIAIRALGGTDRPEAVVVWFQATLFVLASLGLLVTENRWLEWPSAELVPYLVLTGVMATAGQLLLTHAYKLDRAATVAAAAYTSPLWAVIVDALFFSIVPGGHVWLGGAIIVGAGLFLVFRAPGDNPRPERPATTDET